MHLQLTAYDYCYNDKIVIDSIHYRSEINHRLAPKVLPLVKSKKLVV